jgi:integrase
VNLVKCVPSARLPILAPCATSTPSTPSCDWWRPFAERLGRGAGCQKEDKTFPRITAHALRHTAASLAVSAGANVKVVQRMLGHASAAMTLDVYARLV